MFLLYSASVNYSLLPGCERSHIRKRRGDELEFIGTLLPTPIAFNPNAHTTKDHLLTAPEVDTQLNNISIPDSVKSRDHIGLT